MTEIPSSWPGNLHHGRCAPVAKLSATLACSLTHTLLLPASKVFPESHLRSALPRPTQASRDGEAYQVEVAQTRNSRGALLEKARQREAIRAKASASCPHPRYGRREPRTGRSQPAQLPMRARPPRSSRRAAGASADMPTARQSSVQTRPRAAHCRAESERAPLARAAPFKRRVRRRGARV